LWRFFDLNAFLPLPPRLSRLSSVLLSALFLPPAALPPPPPPGPLAAAAPPPPPPGLEMPSPENRSPEVLGRFFWRLALVPARGGAGGGACAGAVF
jgi:hypothetical protein